MSGSFSGSDFSGTAVADSPATESISSAPETTSATTETSATPADSTPVETVTPVAAATTETAPEKKRRGNISTDDHEKVVKNTREKTRAEVEKEWEPYAWAKTADKARFEQSEQWRSFASRDPIGFLEHAITTAEENPSLAPQIKSLAARLLGKRGTQQVEAAFDEEPGPDIPTDTSNGVPMVFSAAQQRKREAWFERQLLAKVGQAMAPIQQETQATRQEREHYQALTQANDFAQREFTAAQQWPGFTQHQKTIAERMAKLQLQSDDPREVSLALRDVYLAVVGPSFSTNAHSAAIADVGRKVAASSVNPSTTLTAPPKDASRMSFHDLLKAEFAKQ